MHLSRKTQIASLKADKAPIKVFNEYADFVDIFLPKLVVKLFKHLGQVELEIVKAYIKNSLANGFIRPSKSPAKALILFNKKLNESLRLYINYQGLFNPTIKNQYSLPLVRELLN